MLKKKNIYIYIKYDINEFVYETEIDRLTDKENRLIIAKGGVKKDWELEIRGWKLLCIE